MKRQSILLFWLICAIFIVESTARAGNGSQVIGVGPISRAMGGTGIANPQSAVSAIYLNPGSLIFTNRMDFGASILNANVTGTVNAGVPLSAESNEKLLAMPSIGMAMHPKEWFVMGAAVIGEGGGGTDWRTTPLEPFVGTSRMFLSQMAFIVGGSAKLLNESLGIGVSFPITYQMLDLGTGLSNDVGLATKIGIAYELRSAPSGGAERGQGLLRLGAYFKSPQLIKPKHQIIGMAELSNPMELGLGVSYIGVKNLIVSLNGKYILWESAEGFGDPITEKGLDWQNQFVVAFGVQLGSVDKPIFNLFLFRAGYNYGSSVLKDDYQPTIEMPLAVNHHVSFGMSVDIGLSMHLNFGGVIGLKGSTNTDTTPRQGQGELSIWSIDVGMSGIFG
ncbi:MAG: hypothetical protein OEZ36_11770, partial [Spirochaetota bacterium]|nr:hypothetical protein [Spirochaetota bacterium]